MPSVYFFLFLHSIALWHWRPSCWGLWNWFFFLFLFLHFILTFCTFTFIFCSSHCCDINFPFAPCWPPPQEVEPGLFSAPWLLHFHSNTPRRRIKTQGFQGVKSHVLGKQNKSEQILYSFSRRKKHFSETVLTRQDNDQQKESGHL